MGGESAGVNVLASVARGCQSFRAQLILGEDMTAILLRNATLVDGTVPEPREGCHVAIEDGLIVAVGDGPGSAGEEAQVIDLEGRTLMPGLIDAHVHVTATTLDFARLQSEPASYNAVKARAIMRAMLDRGFTTVRDAGGADWGLAMAVEHGLIEGPRLIYSGRALSQTGGHGDLRPRVWNLDICACCALSWELAVIADGVDAVRRAAREELRRGAKQIKIMASGGVASPRDPVWKSGICNIPTRKSPLRSGRPNPGAPMSWPMPTRRKRSRALCTWACVRSSTAT